MIIEQNNIYCIDCVHGMHLLPHDYVDLTVTSPSYDDLRTYNGYEWNIDDVSEQLYRITKPGGVVVWVVADQTIKCGETLTSFRQAIRFQEVGFLVHDTMIYKKPNFSNPSKTRYHQTFEYMFVFSKGKPKTFNPIKDRKNIMAGQTCLATNTYRQPDGSFKERKKRVYSEYGMRHNVWEIKTAAQEAPCKEIKHPAKFPDSLARDHIVSWSNEEDLVFDPFSGSGTTCIQAKLLNRRYLGFDCSEEYVTMAKEAIQNDRK